MRPSLVINFNISSHRVNHQPRKFVMHDTRAPYFSFSSLLLLNPQFQYLGGGGLPPLYTTSRSMYLSSSLYQGSRLIGGGGSIASRLGGSSITGTGARTRFSHSSSLTRLNLAFLMSSESPTSRATSSYEKTQYRCSPKKQLQVQAGLTYFK
jgi:hypothetical protein